MFFEVRGLEAGYGPIQVLWNVSLQLSEGEFVGLLGPNGAGKTTTLKTLAGLINPLSGQVEFMGRSIEGLSAPEITKLGVSLIPEDLNLFTKMSVHDNLTLGAYAVRDKKQIARTLDLVLDLFPVLADRRDQLAGTLSGGERKMLAIGRGLMSNPRLLLVDEPSLGLAPNLVDSVLEALQKLNQTGLAILLVEQNVYATLEITERSYLLEQGQIVLEGASVDLVESDHVKEAYLGIGEE